MKWLKKKTLKWLGLDCKIYIGVDWHIAEYTAAIIIKVKNDGTMEVIGDHRIPGNYREVLRDVQALSGKYRTREIIHDFPRGFLR